MSELYDIKEEQERVILVSVCTDDQDAEESLDELEELVDTAGAVTLGRMIQNREKVHPGTYIGKGKIEELSLYIRANNATGIVCDDELSPAQLKNLQEELNIKVMDRTLVILDIFAKRATTKEGKIQVELAQLKYRMSRLIGSRDSLSRLGGGIGTRGPGEKKLEIDRRLIGDRISFLKKEVEELAMHREISRNKRKTGMLPVVAIVGYTNAGKSTLLNKLTEADILAEDKLFATLDPTTRNFKLPGDREILLTDTVGFIRKLPHHLIDAFRSTLEEAKYADIIIHMADSHNKSLDSHMVTVYDTLNKLGAGDKPVITFFNKSDINEEKPDLHDPKADYVIYGSVKTGEGLDELINAVSEIVNKQSVHIDTILSFDKAGIVAQVRKYGALIKEEYIESGIHVIADVPSDIYGKYFKE